MNLNRSIVIVNQYTLRPKGGGKGSRGSSPGQYVLRYMARELATETVAPIRRTPIEDFAVRYMARESASEWASSLGEMKRSMKAAQGEGGVAFGYGSSSLSDVELAQGAKDLQSWYERNHTVLKTVISFDHEYLRERGIIEPDFEIDGKGDYRGNIDQMKLRLGVMAGLGRMSRGRYDDLRYVGVIQVDTEHVHAHLAMVDAGRGQVMPDGSQRGKIDTRAKSLFRRGMDAWLDEKQSVAHLSSAVGYEKRNVTAYVKRWTHQQMLKESMPQFLLACLPADRSLWRAGTNDRRMRKANTIVTGMVEEMLSQEDSPMGLAMTSVQEYANTRREQEGLSAAQWSTLVQRGRSEIVDGCVNGVYSLMRSLPQDSLRVRTPMLDAMSMDFHDMALRASRSRTAGAEQGEQGGSIEQEDPMVDFGFRLRSYAGRLEHHRGKRQEYREQVRTWDQAYQVGAAVEASRVLRSFYEEEEEYHAMCMAKYRYFLPMASGRDAWYEQWSQVADYGERVLSLEMMTKDDSLRKLGSADEAEARGIEIYGQRGGSLMTQGAPGKAVLSARAQRARGTYERKIEDLRVEMIGAGLSLVVSELDDPGVAQDAIEQAQDADVLQARSSSGRLVAQASPGVEYPFEEVKALDMHHMRYDFVSDVPVGPRSRDAFVTRAQLRSQLLDQARSYLELSGQGEQVATLPVADVEAMSEIAQRMSQLPRDASVLPSRVAELEALAADDLDRRRSRTVSLDAEVSEQIEQVISSQSREILAKVVPVQFRIEQRAAQEKERQMQQEAPDDLSTELS